MTDLSENKLKAALQDTASAVDLDEATRGLVARAEGEGLIDVAYARVDSPFGEMLVAGTERGIIRVAFPHRQTNRLLDEIAEQISPRILEAPERLDDVRRQLDDYFEGRRTEFDLRLDWRLARGFQSKALHQIARIPYGKTLSYSEVAAKAGSPRAVRATGTACGANPLPPIVPCHRVVPAGGGVGNYGGGPEMKKALLNMEGALDSG